MRTGDRQSWRAGPEAEHSVQRICCHTMVTQHSPGGAQAREPYKTYRQTDSSKQLLHRWIKGTCRGLLAYTHF